MINVLLIIDDINYSKSILNNLNKLNPNLRFCEIVSEEEEVKLALKYYDIDIILLDYKLQKNMKIIFSNKNCTIFIFQTKNKNVKYFDNNKRNLSINDIPNEFNQAKKIRRGQERLQKEKIQKELEYLGYNPNYNGTKYLEEAIYILSTLENDDCNLEKEIYPIVAKKYNKTVHNVKCNIINSTNNMVYDCIEEKLNEYLGFCTYSKPGPKKIIYAVMNKI